MITLVWIFSMHYIGAHYSVEKLEFDQIALGILLVISFFSALCQDVAIASRLAGGRK